MKTLIWSKSTRIFHWLLATGFTATYILGENKDFLNYHFAFGAFVGSLLLFRILYGLFGPQYSNFKDFPIGISNQISFIKNFISKSYVGHNPMASLVMLGMMFTGIFCAVSGYLLAVGENNVLGVSPNEETIEDVHKILAKLFLGLVIVHLIGIFTDVIFHKKMGTLNSIFTGYKNVQAETIQTNTFHKVFSVLWFTIPFLIGYLAFGLPNNEENESDNNSKKTEQVEKNEHHEDD